MIATGKKCGAARRAKCGCVKSVVAKPLIGQPLQRWRLSPAAEGAGLAETYVIKEAWQHVGRTGRGHWQGHIVGFGIRVGTADAALKLRVGKRQNIRHQSV